MASLKALDKIIGLPFLLLVQVYQKTLSPDHGLTKHFYPYGYCKFYPSCSEYARISLDKQGITALPKIIKRIFSCRPGATGGIDHPFSKKT